MKHAGWMALLAMLTVLGCTSPINAPPVRYSVQGNHEDIASCLYRQAEDTHTYGRDVHLTRLSNPTEIRVVERHKPQRHCLVGVGSRAVPSWPGIDQPAGAAGQHLVERAAVLERGP